MQRILGVAARDQLTLPECFQALHFHSRPPCTYCFHQTPPRGRTADFRTVQSRYSGTAPLLHRCGIPSVRAPRGLDVTCRTSYSISMPIAPRVAGGGYPPPALTEPYKCCSHTALRDARLLLPSVSLLRDHPLSQAQHELTWDDDYWMILLPPALL